MSNKIVGELIYKIVGDTGKFQGAIEDTNRVVSQLVRSKAIVQLGNQLTHVGVAFDKTGAVGSRSLTQLSRATEQWARNNTRYLSQGVASNHAYAASVHTVGEAWGSAVAKGESYFTMLSKASAGVASGGVVVSGESEASATSMSQSNPVGDVKANLASNMQERDVFASVVYTEENSAGIEKPIEFLKPIVKETLLGAITGGKPGAIVSLVKSLIDTVEPDNNTKNSEDILGYLSTPTSELAGMILAYQDATERLKNPEQLNEREFHDYQRIQNIFEQFIPNSISKQSAYYNQQQTSIGFLGDALDSLGNLKKIVKDFDFNEKNIHGEIDPQIYVGNFSSDLKGKGKDFGFGDVKNAFSDAGFGDLWDKEYKLWVDAYPTIEGLVQGNLHGYDMTLEGVQDAQRAFGNFLQRMETVASDSIDTMESEMTTATKTNASLIFSGAIDKDTLLGGLDNSDFKKGISGVLDDIDQLNSQLDIMERNGVPSGAIEQLRAEYNQEIAKLLGMVLDEEVVKETVTNKPATPGAPSAPVTSMPPIQANQPVEASPPVILEVPPIDIATMQQSIIESIEPNPQDMARKSAIFSTVAGHQAYVANYGLSEEDKLNNQRNTELAEVEEAELSGILNAEEAETAMDTINASYDQMIADMKAAEMPSWDEWTNAAFDSFNQLASGIDQLVQAQSQQKLAMLESQMQAEMEAMGLVEQEERNKYTKAREDKAGELADTQAALAKETDIEKRNELIKQENKQKVALDEAIAEEEKEEQRLAIEERYEKEMAQIKYKAALFSWNIQRVQAIAGTAQAVINTIATTPFPLNLAMVPVTIATGALQLAVLNASKPEPPQFALGALEIPEDMQATIHQGEMILPRPFAEDVRQGNIAVGGVGSGVAQNNVKVEIYTNEQVQTEETQEGDMTKLKVIVGKAWIHAYQKGEFDNPMMNRHGLKKRGIR